MDKISTILPNEAHSDTIKSQIAIAEKMRIVSEYGDVSKISDRHRLVDHNR